MNIHSFIQDSRKEKQKFIIKTLTKTEFKTRKIQKKRRKTKN